ncbi:MAG: ABC transporter ATP-binding protein [Anaerolineaceae bacterium]
MSDQYFEEEEFETKFSGKTFARIVALAKPHWKSVLGFFTSILIVSGLDAFFTFISKHIIDDGIVAHNEGILVNYVILYGSLILVQAVFVLIFIYLVGILGERVRFDLRQKMFKHLQELSLSYYSRTPVGWIMARVTSDSERVADLITWGLLDSSWAAMNILTSMVFMLIINWKLALIVLATLPVLFKVAVEFRKRILAEFRNVRRTNSKIVGSYNEDITGVRVIKALGREKENMVEFGHLTDTMYRSSFRAAWLSALFLPVVQMITAVALGFIVWYGGIQAQYGSLTVGSIQAFVAYVTAMMWPIQDLARVFADMQHAIASAERIFSLEDAMPEVVDRQGAIDPGTIQSDIEFDHVSFAYTDAPDVPVIHDLSLHIYPGETIALVGPTGGGKTTIVNLLCRFYEPTSGVIRFNHQDYTELTLKAIQSRIGIVLQTPHLFSGTIRDNIRYGRLDATDDEIEEAAKLAGAHDFITHFTKGFNEEVGEGGNLLSVGQKQLLSLARAILAKPEIFIMDEATSSVDTLTEALIQRGMEHLMQGRTSFVIAHRLSTIRHASRILVIEGGQVIEMGTHSELLAVRGKYYQLYTQQFRQQMENALNPLIPGSATT